MKKLFLFLLVSNLTLAADSQPANFLDTGISKLKLGLLLQNWAIYDVKNTTSKSNFRLRRTEIKLSGNVFDNSSFVLMIDPAKSLKTGAIDASNDNKILQDFVLNYTLNSQFEVSTGQFKIPTSAEGLLSSSALILPERSAVGRNYGDRRELGVKLSFKKDIYKIQTMISNGTKSNVDDTNTKKDLALRVDLAPLKGLSVGSYSSLIEMRGKKLKYGLNLFWDNNPESFHFEFGRDESNTVSGVKKSKGYMFDLGYFFDPEWQAVVRYEKLNFSRTATEIESSESTLGLNYFIKESNSKIQFGLTFLNNMSASNGSYDVVSAETGSNELVTMNFQMSF